MKFTVTKLENGYLLDEETYTKVCQSLLSTSSKLKFLHKSFIAIDESIISEDRPYDGMDDFFVDIFTRCDETYDSLEYGVL